MLVVCGQRVYALWTHDVVLPTPTRSNVISTEAVGYRLDTTALATLSLFQVPPTDSATAFRVGVIEPDSPLLIHAPESSLQARLTGVLSGLHGIAVVEYAGQQQSYLIGEKVAGEASVVRILNDRIIISHQGQYEALLLN